MTNDVLFPDGVVVRLNLHPRTVEAAVAAAARVTVPLAFGVMARDHASPASGAAFACALHDHGLSASIGLGDGSADQWEPALRMALRAHPAHLNQIFPAAGLSAWALRTAGASTVVNALVSPTGRPGWVRVATGPQSGRHAGGSIDIAAALDMMAEVGVTSVKFYPLPSDGHAELAVVAREASERNIIVEPTGGITPDNVAVVLDVCLQEGATRVMPHLYSSVRDATTGDLDPCLVEAAGAAVDGVLNGVAP